jgi:hypothetical protein
MGANAQTTVPTFVASQVLTAEQQNQSARTGVPVFATTVERDAAFGGAGEKTLAEGQLCYLESTNVVQYYDGAAWATVGPQTLASGLNFVSGAAFTTVSSVSLAASTFTSTYRNYRIILNITASASATVSTMRMRASGVDDSSSVYRYASRGLTSTNVAFDANSNSTTSWQIISTNTDPQPSVMVIDVIAPQVATHTLVTGTFAFSDASYNLITQVFGGRFGANTQFDALSFLFAGNMSGVYRVYGYSDS